MKKKYLKLWIEILLVLSSRPLDNLCIFANDTRIIMAENEGQQWELVFIYLLVLVLCNYSRFKYLGILVVKLGF